MKIPTPSLVVTLLLITSTSLVSSARILGVFPHIGKSHYFVFESLMKALAARGHDVHVISHFPQDKPVANLTDIDVSGTITTWKSLGAIKLDEDIAITHWNIRVGAKLLVQLGLLSCENILAHPEVQKLINSDQKFDLIINELFNIDCFLGFAHKFQAPHIAISSCNMMPWANDRFANPDHPAYIPNIMSLFSDQMTFAERVENTLFNLILKVIHSVYGRPSEEIAKRYFGASMPSLDELARNTSLVLVNSHVTLNRPRPLVPAVIEVGGIHVKPVQALSQDLDAWIKESPAGVIFFSMGSMIDGKTLNEEKQKALLEAFRELPQRVLWKWEGEALPGQPENVRISKWFPQRDVLSHPNVVLFLTHCGLLGVIEAVHSGVPMVGIPIYGDQTSNLRALLVAGAAVHLDYHTITKQSVLTALRAVLEDARYRENAQRLSRQYLDRPASPMDTAIFWTEYVIRHKGASHLRSAAVDLPWYQYLLVDVILTIAVAVISVLFVITFLVKKLVNLGKGRCFETSTKSKRE